MRILIFGENGFVGRNIHQSLITEHEVFGASRDQKTGGNHYNVDLLDKASIAKTLKAVQPQVVINAAGIVVNSEAAMQNVTFTTNILEEIVASGLGMDRIIISGSAAEYGLVEASHIPVKEDEPLKATSGYGLSKLKEEQAALSYGKEHQLPIIVARIFNPIGAGMHPRLLLPGLITQVEGFKRGERSSLEVSRLDTRRDYIDIRDVAQAVSVLIQGSPGHNIYNIGSGQSTSTGELIELILSHSQLGERPKVAETAVEPELIVAIQADISRLKTEFGWSPQHSLEVTVKEIMHGTQE